MTGYELYFNIIIEVSKYNLQSTSGGGRKGMHDKLEDKRWTYKH